MIIRSSRPEVIESPFEELDGNITPTERFYVRDHFPQPSLSLDQWCLRVEGKVRKTIEISYEDLLAMPSKTICATLECAGNGRTFLVPPVSGVQWQLGAVGNAEWTGVPFSAVLDRAGMSADAREVIFEGADRGEPEANGKPVPRGPIHFARSVPVEKAMRDVLLAYRMNGEPLNLAHGFPLRVIVPGWYAMASVKWLNRIVVSDKEFGGYFQTTDYAFWTREFGDSVRVPITRMQTKAQIAKPQPNERIPNNAHYEIFGAAWCGEAEIRKVEISTNGGTLWNQCTLLGESIPNSWRLWKFAWHTPTSPGPVTLMARATDSLGNSQALEHHHDCAEYMISFCLPIKVEIE